MTSSRVSGKTSDDLAVKLTSQTSTEVSLRRFQFSQQTLALFGTVLIACFLFTFAAFRYDGFATTGVALNLLDDNAFLGVTAVGMTFVILSGGIDLSVGSVIGLTSLLTALMVEKWHVNPMIAIPAVLLTGAALGTVMGIFIAFFELAPFLVTLAGMFFARGLAYSLSLESIPLTHPFFVKISEMRMTIGRLSLSPNTLIFLAVVLAAMIWSRSSKMGRAIFAIGGNKHSSQLMGLSVRKTEIFVYALSGTLAALAGVVYTFYTSSGNATAASGLELDAIAAVVIGGTLLIGGRGSVFGTFIGVLILGMIQTMITFESTLNSWWTKIIIGALLFAFVVFQRGLAVLVKRKPKREQKLARPSLRPAVLTLFCLVAASSLVATKAWAQVCPPGQYSGAKIAGHLYQMTGTFIQPGQTSFPMGELPDPSPPLETVTGAIEIYGSAKYFIRYKNWAEFEKGGCYEVVPLALYNPGYVGFDGLYDQPWDVRKFQILSANGVERDIMVGGAMSPLHGRKAPLWPDDNISRRIYFFRPDLNGRWLRDLVPIVGEPLEDWKDHSYGANLIQVGSPAANVIREDQPGEIGVFYERVSNVTGGSPYVTEIFAKRITTLGNFAGAISGPEIPILTLQNPPYPATKRTSGGYLMEGPRPSELTIKGKTFYFIAFSSGDFATDSYTMNMAWSRNLFGPYKPFLTSSQDDLYDFGSDLKKSYDLSWVGRPALFKNPKGQTEMLFHGVRKSILPDNNYAFWPEKYQLWEFFRCIFKVNVDFRLDTNDEPIMEIKFPQASAILQAHSA